MPFKFDHFPFMDGSEPSETSATPPLTQPLEPLESPSPVRSLEPLESPSPVPSLEPLESPSPVRSVGRVPSRPVVLLFDIDGTLISAGGAGRRAIDGAFTELFGRPDACESIAFGGMTDRAIARLGLRAIGQPTDDDAIERLLQCYLRILEHEVTRSDRYRVLPGVEGVLEALRDRPRVALGLGTGNVRTGAMLKLRRGALDHRFSFGGFGCDHEDRAMLLAAGARRGAELLGEGVDRCRLVVIGDTPKDVAAALAIGARCIGVGTGGVDPSALIDLGAVCAFPDLTAEGVVEALLEA